MATFFCLCLCLNQVSAVPVHRMGENAESEWQLKWFKCQREGVGTEESEYQQESWYTFVLQCISLEYRNSKMFNGCVASFDPASAHYGQHLSLDEVQQLLASPPESRKTVRSWLREGGVRQMQEYSNGVQCVGGKFNASQAVVSFLHEYFSPVDLLSLQLQYSSEY